MKRELELLTLKMGHQLLFFIVTILFFFFRKSFVMVVINRESKVIALSALIQKRDSPALPAELLTLPRRKSGPFLLVELQKAAHALCNWVHVVSKSSKFRFSCPHHINFLMVSNVPLGIQIVYSISCSLVLSINLAILKSLARESYSLTLLSLVVSQ